MSLPIAVATPAVNYATDGGTALPIPFAATTAAGTPIDLTGVAVICLVKWTRDDPDAAALATLTTANGGVVIPTPSTGQGTVIVPPWATAAVQGRATLKYAIRAYVGGLAVYDLQTGQIAVTQQAVLASGQATTGGIVRGAPFIVTISNLLDASGNPLPFTGAALVWTTSGAGVLTKQQAQGQVTVSPGLAVIPLAASDTAGLADGSLAWTLTDANNGNQQVAAGVIGVV